MEGFDNLQNLQKLYLQNNKISRLEGLQNCRFLEELILSAQQLRPDQEFTFDEYSLAGISSSL